MRRPYRHYRPYRLQNRGSTLLIAFWALLLLSAVVFAWAKWVHRRLETHREETLGLEARALALSGVAIAGHPEMRAGSPLLSADQGNERSYSASIKGEGGKLNLIYLLRGEDPVRLAFFQDYLAHYGLKLEEREAFIDGVLDWMDSDDLKRNRGAEEEGDYKPTNRALSSLEELPLIRGTAPLIAANPNWRNDFTLFSTGPLDVMSAPAHLLALLPGVDERGADAFVKFRQGEDGIDGSTDDPAIPNVQDALLRLGLSSEEQPAVSALVSFNDSTVFIESTGRAGTVERRISLIARRAGPNSALTPLIWIEP